MYVKIMRMAEATFERNPSRYSPTIRVFSCLQTHIILLRSSYEDCRGVFLRSFFSGIQIRHAFRLHRAYWQLLPSQTEHVLCMIRVVYSMKIKWKNKVTFTRRVRFKRNHFFGTYRVTKLREGGSNFVNSPGPAMVQLASCPH